VLGDPGSADFRRGSSGKEAPRLVLAGGCDDRRLDESPPRRIERGGVGEDGFGVGGARGLGSFSLRGFPVSYAGRGGSTDNFFLFFIKVLFRPCLGPV